MELRADLVPFPRYSSSVELSETGWTDLCFALSVWRNVGAPDRPLYLPDCVWAFAHPNDSTYEGFTP